MTHDVTKFSMLIKFWQNASQEKTAVSEKSKIS